MSHQRNRRKDIEKKSEAAKLDWIYHIKLVSMSCYNNSYMHTLGWGSFEFNVFDAKRLFLLPDAIKNSLFFALNFFAEKCIIDVFTNISIESVKKWEKIRKFSNISMKIYFSSYIFLMNLFDKK